MSDTSKTFAAIISIMVFLIIIFMHQDHVEKFSDEMKRERAMTIYENLKNYTDMPSYPQFKKMIPQTDAVEYIDISKLKKKRLFTIKNVEQALGIANQ